MADDAFNLYEEAPTDMLGSSDAADPFSAGDTASHADEHEAPAEKRESTERAAPHTSSGGGGATTDATAVALSNLTWWTTDRDVERLCGDFGKVRRMTFNEDKVNGKSKGYVVVEFSTPAEAQAVHDKLHNMMLNEKPVQAEFVPPAQLRQMHALALKNAGVKAKKDAPMGGPPQQEMMGGRGGMRGGRGGAMGGGRGGGRGGGGGGGGGMGMMGRGGGVPPGMVAYPFVPPMMPPFAAPPFPFPPPHFPPPPNPGLPLPPPPAPAAPDAAKSDRSHSRDDRDRDRERERERDRERDRHGDSHRHERERRRSQSPRRRTPSPSRRDRERDRDRRREDERRRH